MTNLEHDVHLDDQVLAALRNFPHETARFVVVRIYNLPRGFLHSTTAYKQHRRRLVGVEARVASLRRRRLIEVTGRSDRDGRQNTYALTDKADRRTVSLADLPPLTVRSQE